MNYGYKEVRFFFKTSHNLYVMMMMVKHLRK